MQRHTKEATYIVGLNGTKRKVLSRYRHFAQSVEQGTLANIRQTHNSHLYTDRRFIVTIILRACDLSWHNREEETLHGPACKQHQHERNIRTFKLDLNLPSTGFSTGSSFFLGGILRASAPTDG